MSAQFPANRDGGQESQTPTLDNPGSREVVAAGKYGFRAVPSLEDRRRKVIEASLFIRTQLTEMGYTIIVGETQIIPVWTGDVSTTKNLSDYLLSKGFFVPSIRPPTVARGEGRVRLSISHDVLGHGVESLIEAFRNYSERPQKKGEARIVQSS